MQRLLSPSCIIQPSLQTCCVVTVIADAVCRFNWSPTTIWHRWVNFSSPQRAKMGTFDQTDTQKTSQMKFKDRWEIAAPPEPKQTDLTIQRLLHNRGRYCFSEQNKDLLLLFHHCVKKNSITINWRGDKRKRTQTKHKKQAVTRPFCFT